MMSASGDRDFATLGVLAGLLLLAGGLLGLMAVVAPHLFGIAAILIGFLALGSLHYLLWGWWLRPQLMKQEDEQQNELK